MRSKWLSNEWIKEMWNEIDDIEKVEKIIEGSKILKSLKETYEKIETKDDLYDFTKEFVNIYTAKTTTKEERRIMDTFDSLIANRIKDGDKIDAILKDYKECIKSRFEFEKNPKSSTGIKLGFSVVGSLTPFSSIDDFIESIENENQEEEKVDEKPESSENPNEPVGVGTDFN